MTRVIVFFGVALVVASLGSVGQASGKRTALVDNSRVQTLAAALDSSAPPAVESSQAPGSAQSGGQTTTTGDRAKRIEAVDERSENVGKESAPLPQTSTILPLLGLIGLGSLVAGLFARR